MFHPARSLPRAALALTVLLTGALVAGPGQALPGQALPGETGERLGVTGVEARWDSPIEANAAVSVVVTVHGQPGAVVDLVVDLQGVDVVGIPEQCQASGTLDRRSSINVAAARLDCRLSQAEADQEVVVSGTVAAAEGESIGGRVTADGSPTTLVERTVAAGPPAPERRLRLLSSPDFLNADIGDLRKGPGFWKRKPPGTRSRNGTNSRYRTALQHVFSDWQSLDPAGVLVAGDLVEGRWGEDSQRTGNFGPIRTDKQRRQAVRRAAATFYPQWLQRFTDHGLTAYPAIGDHELGDNAWPHAKRQLVGQYQREFARYITRTDGAPRFADRPRGRHGLTAYAFRPSPDVQIVSLDPFDITQRRSRIHVDGKQMRWLTGVLARAQRDGVRWTVVQGHVPILGPVRTRGSSDLHYPRAEKSKLWRLLQAYGVDLYLDGEVHDVTLASSGGVAQLSHGGLFGFGGTNYAVLDFYDDHIQIDLRDYATTIRRHGGRLWETRMPGSPAWLSIDPMPFTIGSATITSGGLSERSGALLPYVP